MTGASSAQSDLTIDCAFAPKISFALYQNSVPVLMELAVTNDGRQSWEDLVLRLESEPAFFRPREWRLTKIGPGQHYAISELDLRLDGGQLARLTEAEKGEVRLTLKDGETVLCRLDKAVELLARNEWGGLGQFPEMAAAFVRPNDPAVDQVLKKAAGLLLKAGKESAMEGYEKGGKRRVWEIMSAIWHAVCSLGLDYALPPAGFEHDGQKVRSPEQIIRNGLGTCLDLSFLFAACLEQCQLNPLLIFLEGHAFAGGWLVPEVFAVTTIDDVAALRKRIQLQEIILFEPTLAVRGQQGAAQFKWSCQVGARQVSEEETRAFQLALDIKRARMERIRPLASDDGLTAAAVEVKTTNEPPNLLRLEEAPDLVEVESQVKPQEPVRPQDRLDRWQRKLLDLSLRNNLLNFRATKRVVELIVPDPGRLEDMLSEGKRFKLHPGVRLMQGHDPRDKTIHQARHREEVGREHALEALAKGELFTRFSEEEMERRLVALFRASRLALQEGGANTLFLVMGFLVWNQGGKDERRLKAPLILVPVSLARQAVRAGFSLTLHEDEPRFNLTLLEMLRQDFQLTLPELEGVLPRDDSGLDVIGIWRRVATAIKDLAGWEVAEEVCLGQFSFAKYLMWKDLAERTDQLRQSPVVRHLIDTPNQTYGDRSGFVPPAQLDRVLPPAKNFCPLPADSSQLAAVVAAAQGHDFVMEGPPGTGKSQTIANLIAQCLATGKTVLFVAEKTAALDVVYRRLRAVGLGEFCLELHSHKANKMEVLKQLKESWEVRVGNDWDTWKHEGARMANLREQLNALVHSLHHRWRNGLSVFSAISKALASQDTPVLHLSWFGPEVHDQTTRDRLLDIATRLGINAAQVKGAADTGLSLVTAQEWSPGWEASITSALKDIIPLCREVDRTAAELFAATGLPVVPLSGRGRQALTVLAGILPEAAGRDWRFLLRPDGSAIFSRLHEGLALVAKRKGLLASLRGQETKLADLMALDGQAAVPWTELENELLAIHATLKENLSSAGCGLEPVAGNSVDHSDRRNRVVQLEGRIKGLSKAVEDRFETLMARLAEGKDLDRQRQENWNRLSIAYEPSVFDLDLRELQAAWCQAESTWWPKSYFGRRRVHKVLCVVAEDLNAAAPDCGSDLELLLAVCDLDAKLQAFVDLKGISAEGWAWSELERKTQAAVIRLRQSLVVADRYRDLLVGVAELDAKLVAYQDLHALTAGLWQGLDTNPEEVTFGKALAERLKRGLSALYDQPDAIKTGLEALHRLIGENHIMLQPSGGATRSLTNFQNADKCHGEALAGLAQLLAGVEGASNDVEAMDPRTLAERCQTILSQTRLLRPWCAWNRVCAEARAQGLGVLVEALSKGDLASDQAREAFSVNYCRWWINAAVETDQLLRRFVSAEHEQAIADFRSLDQRLADLARDCIRASLRNGTPESEAVRKNSEWGILRREMEKKRRHIPLRQLVEKLPTVLPVLTPCLLMSPLSIAQYLPPDRVSFDLVVFDEASQIPVWDAIGAIARGQRLVVVGDPKQLPPTNFFNRAEDEEADDEVEIGGDMESILDECLSAGLPTQRLNWHYRSRHESLIAFSNRRYYGGSLVTFPSPATSDRAVSFRWVENGVYDKGASRTNQAEAKALVADILDHLHDPVFAASGKSVGVVTFNSQQQKLIEDLLDEERRNDPGLERFFSDELTEPVFVKNLENVQGDERDLMYFSITYGPNPAGRLSMNFGPLNKDGGERRLNVAVTRARHELMVFASLLPEQFDLSRTKAKGVADLKLFLDYARRGVQALTEEVLTPRGDFDSPFEEIVADALSQKGWTVHAQVGVSTFRIDLGVVDPDRPGRYLAGVECDGVSYHRSATARDRDKLREEVLRRLGWEIVRTWSCDWWYDPQTALAKIDTRLQAILKQSRAEMARQEQESAREEAERRRIKAERMLDDPAVDMRQVVARPDTEPLIQEEGPNGAIAVAAYAKRSMENNAAPITANDRQQTQATDNLLSDGNEQALAEAIREIVTAEGPIRDDVMARRIARRCGFRKAGAKIRAKVTKAARKEFKFVKEDGGVFIWPGSSTPGQWDRFRATVGDETRSADEISLAELAALAREVVADLGTEEDIVAAMARKIGIQRLRVTTRARLEKAWQMAQESI